MSAAPTSAASFRASGSAWIRDLARPYLRGYRARAHATSSLRGWWFVVPSPGAAGASKAKAGTGFFVGYLHGGSEFRFLHPEPPEALVFAAVELPGSARHGRLVSAPESLLRRTFEYIRWLTHRPPRFEFFAGESIALVRHTPMRGWPAGREEHYARNFFIETLAWVVRSGLARKLREESKPPHRARPRAGGRGLRRRAGPGKK